MQFPHNTAILAPLFALSRGRVRIGGKGGKVVANRTASGRDFEQRRKFDAQRITEKPDGKEEKDSVFLLARIGIEAFFEKECARSSIEFENGLPCES
jgi:hypothetical protein